jgi:hypothetical protein
MEAHTLEDRYINRDPLIELLKRTFPSVTNEADFKVEVLALHPRVLTNRDDTLTFKGA